MVLGREGGRASGGRVEEAELWQQLRSPEPETAGVAVGVGAGVGSDCGSDCGERLQERLREATSKELRRWGGEGGDRCGQPRLWEATAGATAGSDWQATAGGGRGATAGSDCRKRKRLATAGVVIIYNIIFHIEV